MIKEKSIKIKVLRPKKYGIESFAKYGDIVDFDVNKLSKGSHIKITAICDNCGKEKIILGDNLKRGHTLS